jgi:hypothetical protein
VLIVKLAWSGSPVVPAALDASGDAREAMPATESIVGHATSNRWRRQASSDVTYIKRDRTAEVAEQLAMRWRDADHKKPYWRQGIREPESLWTGDMCVGARQGRDSPVGAWGSSAAGVNSGGLGQS